VEWRWLALIPFVHNLSTEIHSDRRRTILGVASAARKVIPVPLRGDEYYQIDRYPLVTRAELDRGPTRQI